MLSDKYPHSQGCMMEADCFLTEAGENKTGKNCLIVLVNVSRPEAPPRFSTGVRIWADYNGHNLVDAWKQPANRLPLIKRIAAEILDAAQRSIALPAEATDPDHPVERFTRGRRLVHRPDDTISPFALPTSLGADPRTVSETVQSSRTKIDIVSFLTNWACADEAPRLTALLGEFGMGKTVTCQLVTQALLRRAADGDNTAPLPLYFDLRDINPPVGSAPITLHQAIGDMLSRAGEAP